MTGIPRSIFLRPRRLRTAFFATAFAISISLLNYFFLLAIVFLGPLRVRAFVLVRWPLTGRPLL